MNVAINKLTVINDYSYGGCGRVVPYFPPIFGGGWGGCCCDPMAPLAAMGGIALGMNFGSVCKGIWNGIKAVGKGIGNFFGWVFRGFKKKPKAVEKEQQQNTNEIGKDNNKDKETPKTQTA